MQMKPIGAMTLGLLVLPIVLSGCGGGGAEIAQPSSSNNVVAQESTASADELKLFVNPAPIYLSERVEMSATAEGKTLRFEWKQLGGTEVLLENSDQPMAFWVSPNQPAELVFEVTAFEEGASQPLLSRVFSVEVSERPQGPVISLQDCATDPVAPGCFEGVKHLLSEVSMTQLSEGSAGQCNPTGLANWPHFRGALHEHTAYSDGAIRTRPSMMFEQVKARGWDFAVSTEHSDTLAFPFGVPGDALDPCEAFDPQCLNNMINVVVSDSENPAASFNKWSEVLAQAEAASDESFTGIRGFEWTSDRFGHINVLFSSEQINAKLGPGYALNMEAFWSWFLAPPSMGGGADGLLIFNHPGREDAVHSPLQPLGGDPAYTFNGFDYVPAADYRVVGVEVFGKGDEYDTDGNKGSWLATALDAGWYVAPAGSEDHHGKDWGATSLPKTVLIARSNQPADLKEAMLARRMYAVAQNHNNIELRFDAIEATEGDAAGAQRLPMGSRLRMPEGGKVELIVSVEDLLGSSDQSGSEYEVQLFSSAADNSTGYQALDKVTTTAGEAAFSAQVADTAHWYFVRILSGEQIVAVSAPIWLMPGEGSLPACKPLSQYQ